MFRDLRADEIEVRIQSVVNSSKPYVILLLYKNARADMNILDETVGNFCWSRDHVVVKGNLYCRVGIKGDDGTWTFKEDCGVESRTECEKGEASDSFKRACVNWGIGRELYTAPFIAVDKARINNGKCRDKFCVEKIVIKNKKITAISIVNQSIGARCFVWQDKNESKN